MNVSRLAPHQGVGLGWQAIVLPVVSVVELARTTPNKLSWGPILWLSGITALSTLDK